MKLKKRLLITLRSIIILLFISLITTIFAGNHLSPLFIKLIRIAQITLLTLLAATMLMIYSYNRKIKKSNENTN